MTREHFDGIAQDYDDQDKVDRARQIADAVRAAVPLTGREGLLEYGAGTGLVAQALQGAVGRLTLADSSSGMRQVAERKVADGALPEGTRVWDLDLTDPEVTLPEENFDLVVSSLVLHHIPDLAPVLAGLHRLLVPGGHLAVADLDSDDGRFHAHLHDFDGHDGFDRHGLARQLRAAGFTDVTVDDCTTLVKHGEVFAVFLAVARR
ncbi:class I SAM-dependent DNA methyltransferase [Ornithinimicrobium pratense]|uniref:Methyltransferase domain-containing protein n=1 Tax=Ornithinimicrobium pratense TaxID=2593973 RepID=A0A5J6V841_9MICO|nr:class I SAM-dependent methyltransferase [Ornithinimicrobium pratense]QFG69948.1 methyltransferase domain-containing protein [Ornithinimicrobium pratense]